MAVASFSAKHGRLPGLYNEEEAAAVVAIAKDFIGTTMKEDMGMELDLEEAIT